MTQSADRTSWHKRRSEIIVVLLSVRLDVPEKSYMNHVAEALRDPGIKLRSFSYRSALFGRWDVLHVHWPETLARHHLRRRRIARLLGMSLMLLRISVGRKAVMRTVHNAVPHERGSRIESILVSALDRRTTNSVLLNPFSEPVGVGRGHQNFLIPHGHYRQFVEQTPYPSSADEFRIMYFGFIKPYKRIEDLLAAFHDVTSSRLRLRLMGRATPALAQTVRRAQERDSRINAHLDFVPDELLSKELGQAHLVVLPYYDTLNSGAILHALSANRPVLVASTDITRWLADEAGDNWVYQFQPPLSAAQLAETIERVMTDNRPPCVRFEGRDWADVAEGHARAYRAVLAG